ncbi:MAG: hypothetical protein ABIS06_04555 [Vicinamibacterales bacterium]
MEQADMILLLSFVLFLGSFTQRPQLVTVGVAAPVFTAKDAEPAAFGML